MSALNMRSFNGVPSKSQSGFTLIELALVVAIIVIAAMVTLSSFNTTDNTNDVRQEIENASALTGAIRNMFSTQGSYEGLENNIILSSVNFPEHMRVPNNDEFIRHSWADDGVEVHYVDTFGSPGDTFSMTWQSVPETSCASFAGSVFRHFLEVRVGSTVITGVANAATACVGEQNITLVSR